MARSKKQAKKSIEKSRTVAKDVVERRIGTDNPYFQVRIRRPNEAHILRRFPYVPENGKVPAEKIHQGMKRTMALEEAVKFASTERGNIHYYGKPTAAVATEQTFRSWLLTWVREALDREDAQGNPLPAPDSPEALGNPLATLPIRKAAKGDKSLMLNLIKAADASASKLKQKSIMDKRVVDLNKADFNGPNGLISLLTGQRKRDADGNLIAEKPPASPETKRRVLATLGSVWNHAAEVWGMEVPRPWSGIRIRSDEKKKETRTLNAEEFIKVEQALQKCDLTTQAAIQFVRWTAARKGEMQKLRWETITWPKEPDAFPELRFEGTKTPRQGAYKERTIHLLPGAVEALKIVNPNKDGTWPTSGIVFKSPSNPEQPISGYTVYQAMTRAVRRAGLKHAHVHSLRHTRTTEISAVITKAQGMKITGHTDERTFNRYTHLEHGTAKQLLKADEERLEMAKRVIEASQVAPVTGQVAPLDADSISELLKSAIKGLSAEQRLAVINKLVSG